MFFIGGFVMSYRVVLCFVVCFFDGHLVFQEDLVSVAVSMFVSAFVYIYARIYLVFPLGGISFVVAGGFVVDGIVCGPRPSEGSSRSVRALAYL